MKYKSIIVGVLIAILVFIVVYYVNSVSWNNSINNYTGDGQIGLLSSGLFFKGYKVEFELFPLDESFVASYKVSNLPTHNKSLVLFFSVKNNVMSSKDENNVLNVLSGASVKFEINRSNGNNVAQVASNLTNWIKTSITDGKTFDYYFMDSQISSILEYEDFKGGDLTINIAYSPPEDVSALSDTKGGIIIRTGGYK